MRRLNTSWTRAEWYEGESRGGRGVDVLAREEGTSRAVELSCWAVVERRGVRLRGVEQVEEGVVRLRGEGRSLGVV